MHATTQFSEPAAVDAWDRWFRWRTRGGLHDRTIDDTWRRVAGAIAGTEPTRASDWAARFAEAFRRWQLLPDARLLRTAGTGSRPMRYAAPAAVLNVAAFVHAPRTRQAWFDRERFVEIAALAVRLLDDALLPTHAASDGAPELRIGLIGLGDALQLLGVGYHGPRATRQTCAVGAALACGTARGSTELAVARGPLHSRSGPVLAQWRKRGLPVALVDEAAHSGIRHRRLTAIDRQRRLARLANDASDALDPAPRRRHSSATEYLPIADGDTLAFAQRAMRAALQPWIDAPIDYPLASAADPYVDPIEPVARANDREDTYGGYASAFQCMQRR